MILAGKPALLTGAAMILYSLGIDLDRPRELMVSTDSDFDRFPDLRWQHPLR